jgi:hypothetical protein
MPEQVMAVQEIDDLLHVQIGQWPSRPGRSAQDRVGDDACVYRRCFWRAVRDLKCWKHDDGRSRSVLRVASHGRDRPKYGQDGPKSPTRRVPADASSTNLTELAERRYAAFCALCQYPHQSTGAAIASSITPWTCRSLSTRR